ncbi:MAG: hypothetical protein U0269_14260 [Polyangiales bacterium]
MNHRSLALLALALSACTDALVGGRCAPGWIESAEHQCLRTDDAIAVDSASDAANNEASTPDVAFTDAASESAVADSAVCEAPFTICNGECVDLNSDARHCGACGAACETGVCNAALCRVAHAGHLVLIGSDYERSASAQNAILINAVSLGARANVRVLAYTGLAKAEARQRIETILHAGLARMGVAITSFGDARTLPSELSIDRVDALLVYDAALTSEAQSDELARLWSSALSSYCRAGGTVVLLDAATTPFGNWSLAQRTGLLTVSDPSQGSELIAMLPASAAADALAVGVQVRFGTQGNTALFNAEPSTAVFVDEAAPERAMVVHRAVVPPP